MEFKVIAMKRIKKYFNKRNVIIFLLSLGFLILTLYLINQRSWNQSLNNLDKSSTSAKIAANDLLKLNSSASIKDVDEVVSSLRKAAPADCRVNWWDKWRLGVFKSARRYVTDCEALMSDASTLVVSAKRLTRYLRYDKQISGRISKSLDYTYTDSIDNADMDKIIAGWEDLNNYLGSLSSRDEQLQGYVSLVAARTKAIESALIGVATAHGERSQADYDKARAQLVDEYEKLRLLAPKLEALYEDILTEVVDAAAMLS